MVFDAGSHLHLARRRPWLLEHLDAILATVARPDHREDDPHPGRERYYRQHIDLRRWLRVVVDFKPDTRVDRHGRSSGQRAAARKAPMKLTIAGIEFDYHDYDQRGDTLYLHVGAPTEPARAVETPEGHTVEYDDAGAVIGLELLNVRWTLERDGALVLTWPRAEVSQQQLDPVMAQA